MIIAYASAAANPAGGQVDKTVNLAASPLPLGDLQFYGDAVDTEDAEAQWAFEWTILRQPAGPSAAWKDGANEVQNPILTGVQTWGNYRLFLVVTNLNTSETSETNPLKAPNSAFCHVRLLSPRKGIEKPAPGERNHWTQLHKLADLLELLETDADPSPIVLSANVDGTWTAEGYRPGVIVTPDYIPPPNDDSERPWGQAHHYFYVHEALRLSTWSVVLQDGGSAGASAYRFRIKVGDAAAVKANTMTGYASLDLTGAPDDDRAPLVLSKTLGGGLYIDIPAGSYVGVFCIASPSESSGAKVGGGMSITLHAKRVTA